MGTIKIGSANNRKGITVNPVEVFFNGSFVNSIMSGLTEIWSNAKPLVPVMTSNTCDVGEAICSGMAGSNHEPYKAFNGTATSEIYDCWASNNDANPKWIGYRFTTPTCVKKISLTNRIENTGYSYPILTFKIQACNDGVSWVDISGTITSTNTEIGGNSEYSIKNNNHYTYYRLYVLSSQNPNIVAVAELQFYGKQLVGLVPTMTSNTTPYGEASASKFTNSNFMAYHAFDGNDTSTWEYRIGGFNTSGVGEYIQYKFPTSVAVKHIYMYSAGGNGVVDCNWTLEGSNDGTTFTKVQDILQVAGATKQYLSINNNTKYTYYRLICKSATGNIVTNDTRYIIFQTLQFYAEKPLFEALIPTMTTNTTPKGTVSCSSYFGELYSPHKAFDSNDTTFWLSGTDVLNAYVDYTFQSEVTISAIDLKYSQGDKYGSTSATINVYSKNDTDNDFVFIKGFGVTNTNPSISMQLLPEFTCRTLRVQVIGSGTSSDGAARYVGLSTVQVYK